MEATSNCEFSFCRALVFAVPCSYIFTYSFLSSLLGGSATNIEIAARVVGTPAPPTNSPTRFPTRLPTTRPPTPGPTRPPTRTPTKNPQVLPIPVNPAFTTPPTPTFTPTSSVPTARPRFPTATPTVKQLPEPVNPEFTRPPTPTFSPTRFVPTVFPGGPSPVPTPQQFPFPTQFRLTGVPTVPPLSPTVTLRPTPVPASIIRQNGIFKFGFTQADRAPNAAEIRALSDAINAFFTDTFQRAFPNRVTFAGTIGNNTFQITPPVELDAVFVGFSVFSSSTPTLEAYNRVLETADYNALVTQYIPKDANSLLRFINTARHDWTITFDDNPSNSPLLDYRGLTSQTVSVTFEIDFPGGTSVILLPEDKAEVRPASLSCWGCVFASFVVLTLELFFEFQNLFTMNEYTRRSYPASPRFMIKRWDLS